LIFARPKSRIFALSALGHKDVCGFDVPVDDPFAVCSIECVGNFNRQTE